MLFHLQRHSDHHAHPLRPYQTLRNFPDLPRLPSGYPGCFVLAALPPLWFAVMDRKVIAWAGSDLSRMNLMPGKEAYYQKLAGNRGLAPAGT
jgi:alkane 1-monooxygenase